MNTVFDGVIEVIDRRTGAVITRLRTDYVFAPVPGNPSLMLRKTMRQDGTIAMHLFRVSLQR
jgi:hypothetical protein